MTILIDPPPNMYPHCVCDVSPEIECEFPCWQQFGINDDFDPKDENGCCCARRAKHLGIDVKPKTAEQLAQDRVTFERWLEERVAK